MPRVATIADLEKLLKPVVLPGLSAETGEEVTMTIRRIRRDEWQACLPLLPASVSEWHMEDPAWAELPDEERARRVRARAQAREAEWLLSLPEEERYEKQAEAARTTYRLVALALVAPEMTWHQVAPLAADADVLALAVLRHSGFVPQEKTGGAVEAAPSAIEASPIAA